MSDIARRLPDLLALGQIREQEEHEYEQIEYTDGTTSERTKYTPEKAPILELESVVGISNGEPFNFTEGVDYEIIDTDDDGRLETIDFGVGGANPDPGTTFEITYIARSVLIRYIESYEEEIHRFRRNIDYVIDSHYPDTALESRYVDDFEDEELVEYVFESGTSSDANVQNETTFHGDWGLELRNVNSTTCTRIRSTNGLWTYPQRGDTIEVPIQFTHTDDELSFDFMFQKRDGGGKRYYRVTVSAENNQLTVQKNDGSVKSSTIPVNVSQHIDEWLLVEIEIGAIDTIAAEVNTETSQRLGSAQIVDTEYVSGGIRLEHCNSAHRSDVYVDAIDVIERDNAELDQIGALFGELGRRRGRTDENYATFIRSIVQSFAGRGTVDGIKFAVASGLDIDPEGVTVTEDFQDNQYRVSIDPDYGTHNAGTIRELSDLADPSGVFFEFPIEYFLNGDDILIDPQATDITEVEIFIGTTRLGATQLGFGPKASNIRLGDSTLGSTILGTEDPLTR